MSSIDYGTIATITIFTSFIASFGSELAKVVIKYVKKLLDLQKLKSKQ